MTSSRQPHRRVLLFSALGLLALLLLSICEPVRTEFQLLRELARAKLLEKRNCIILQRDSSNHDLQKALYQCAEQTPRSLLLMPRDDQIFRVDPLELISGHSGRRYHHLIEIVGTAADTQPAIDNWQAVRLELDEFSLDAQPGNHATFYRDVHNIASEVLGRSSNPHANVLWVLNAQLNLPCDKTIIAWSLLQTKGFPVWISWRKSPKADIGPN